MKKPRSFEKLWRKRFENFASNAEDDVGIAGWSATGLDARLRKFKEIWNNHPELKKDIWLDAGCGAGTYTRFIAEQLVTPHWYDIGPARHDFGYQPKIMFIEGIKRLQESLRSR